MADLEKGLVPADVSAQIDKLKKGGLISYAVSAPERRMDRLIKGHLDKVALLQARGDTVPERPVYIFNPDSRLLISYALRRDKNPARSGLFAEVVELDEEGKPRHGVSVVSPFQTTNGFVEVAVGDNSYGFAPSFVDMQLDSDDPLKMVPSNISTAELISMLNTEPIRSGETIEEFLARTNAQRATLRKNANSRKERQYKGTRQGITDITNPYIHLIISDRDATPLVEASRTAGLFPIHMSVNELIDVYRYLFPMTADTELNPFSFMRGQWTKGLLQSQADYIPGFLTFDYHRLDRKMIPHFKYPNLQAIEFVVAIGITDGLINNNPVFTSLYNEHLPEDYVEGAKIIQVQHGHYEQSIDPNNAEKMNEYTDWLRKVRLDMALTLYLRGLSEIV